jgi:plastocyanin
MIIKKVNISLAIILIITLSILGISIYSHYNKEEMIQEIIDEEIIEETPEEPIIEKPALIEEPKEVTIFISRYEFDKPEITIKPGTKVIWTNTDDRNHMITNKRLGLFREIRKSLAKGDSFEYTFNDPGTYEILEANFGINGKVIVEKKDTNMITGAVIGALEINGLSFLLISINLFAITLVVLVLGFYVSRHKVN